MIGLMDVQDAGACGRMNLPGGGVFCAFAEKMSLEKLTNTLGVPLGTAEAMVFKKRALLNMEVRDMMSACGACDPGANTCTIWCVASTS